MGSAVVEDGRASKGATRPCPRFGVSVRNTLGKSWYGQANWSRHRNRCRGSGGVRIAKDGFWADKTKPRDRKGRQRGAASLLASWLY